MAGKPQLKLRPLRFENLENRLLLAADLGSFHNVVDPEDVNEDGRIGVVDAFITIDEVRLRTHGDVERLADVDADGRVSIKDAIQVIGRIRDGGETPIPVEVRIERLSTAIESGNLPDQVSVEDAEVLLARLEARHDEITANDGPLEDPTDRDPNREHPGEGGEQGDRNPENPNGPLDGVSDEELRERLNHRLEILDRNNDGSIGEGELDLAELDRLLEHDVDGNRLVDLDELTEAIHSHWEENGHQIADRFDVFAIFDRVDANGDGGITEDEFPSARGWEAIVRADANNDASLTETELLDYAEQVANENLQLLFATLDVDSSGNIDPQDVGLGWFWLQRADEDGNGAISSSEWNASLGSLPARIRERLNRNHV